MHWIDPDHLPEVSGAVDCFLLNSEGEADGLTLQDGTEIHFPPHMGSDVLAALRPGSIVHVRGVRPRGVAMVAAVAIATEGGTTIVDPGPPEDDDRRKTARRLAAGEHRPMQAQGVVRQVLHGPKGEVRGVLPQDGLAGRFPPRAAQDLATVLAPHAPLLLRGDGLVTAHGTVIAVREIGSSAEHVRPVEGKAPKDAHKDPNAHTPNRSGHRDGEGGAPRPL